MTVSPHWVSPSLTALPDGTIPAYELKFVVPAHTAEAVERWAGEHLTVDPHAEPALGNGYRITSVYLDNPTLDVAYRRPGFDVHKYRIRRYGDGSTVQLERKSKQGGRVWKCRTGLDLDQLTAPPADWPSSWFTRELADLHLSPVCAVTYVRTAFVGTGPAGPVRVTLDRSAVGVTTSSVKLDPVTAGFPLLEEQVVVELKYLATMPAAFKQLIEEQRLTPTGLSKYRRCLRAAGRLVEVPADA